MNKFIKILLCLVAASAAIFGIFFLIFHTISVQMLWCTITSILFVGVLLTHLLSTTQSAHQSVRKVSTNLILGSVAGVLLGWTLLFVFLSDEWKSDERNLNTLYIGYLLTFTIGGILLFINYSGATAAQNESNNTQSGIKSKQLLLNKMTQILEEASHPSTPENSDIKKLLDRTLCALRSVPISNISDLNVYSKIEIALGELESAVSTRNTERIKCSNLNCINIIKAQI